MTMQPTLFSFRIWTVAELTRHVRQHLDADPALQDIWLKGEVSNLSAPASGHLYFSLKDATSTLRCVIWKSDAQRLRHGPVDGKAMEVHGRVSVYEAGGQYQLYVDQVQEAGEGALYGEFVRLKQLLEAEGLFDPSRKRQIPPRPARIGVISSETGAAVHDVLDTLRRRMPLLQVILAPAPVQGMGAPIALQAALRALVRHKVDVVIMARGGGSLEDLWAFNDAGLVRAVAASRVPIITGIGHQTDFTLCDFAADVRAPTPTAAAELATPTTLRELADDVEGARARLVTSMLSRTSSLLAEVLAIATQLRLVSPARLLQTERQRLDDLLRRVNAGIFHAVEARAIETVGFSERLEALNPLAVLQRGYSVVSRADDGQIISRLSQVAPLMKVRVTDGDFRVRRS